MTSLDTLVAGIVEPILRAARIPGVGIAIVADGKTVLAAGYGCRDLAARLPMTSRTLFPIASTSKSVNATMLGMLVEEGSLSWDVAVQDYVPAFRLSDPVRSVQVTLRDLITMRTGLPRHDWLWTGNPLSRPELVKRLRHLELTAGFRERQQYNNLTATTAGHVAEIVTGQSWETLVQKRILDPLEMRATTFSIANADDTTASYHENARRDLVLSPRLATEVIAAAGGAIHSTVEDMAKWLLFNLGQGQCEGRSLIQPQTLKEIQAPQVVIDALLAERKPNSMYAMGWVFDSYNGCERLSHGGYLHDVDTEMMLFPSMGVGLIAFSNFGPPGLALPICEHVFDSMNGRSSPRSWHDALRRYEAAIVDTRKRRETLAQVRDTNPSRSREEYVGTYRHEGYGEVQVCIDREGLILQRNQLSLRLRHWHYDVYVFEDTELFSIHRPHAFDSASLLSFHSALDGQVDALMIRLEPTVAPIRFHRD